VFPAFLDTCVLLKLYLCDTLLSIAEAGVYRPLWSPMVITELERNLARRGLDEKRITHRVEQMNGAFPDALVTGYEGLIGEMANDPKDRHVLAAAVRSGAEVFGHRESPRFPARDGPSLRHSCGQPGCIPARLQSPDALIQASAIVTGGGLHLLHIPAGHLVRWPGRGGRVHQGSYPRGQVLVTALVSYRDPALVSRCGLPSALPLPAP
jgi:PIN domain